MSTSDDLNRVHEAVETLESAVSRLRARLGAHIDVLRLADDVERCAADLRRLREQTGTSASPLPEDRGPEVGEPYVLVPDREYDASLWADGDVDDEGLGVPGRRAP